MKRIGNCGNCSGIVWSDQEYVEWSGIVPVHSDCISENEVNPDR